LKSTTKGEILTPEERFERIEKTLDRLVVKSDARAAKADARFDRIERACEFLAQNQAQLSADVVKLAEGIATLARLFDRHTSDGHGGDIRK
jgi:hypothetical protein